MTITDRGRTDGIPTDTGEPVFLPFRMSCFVLSNLVVTVGMLTPGLGVSLCPENLMALYVPLVFRFSIQESD